MNLSFYIFEAISYQNFLKIEQEIFKSIPSYDEYVNKLKQFSKSSNESQWLFNHHAAELAWESNLKNEAKNHIQIANRLNPFGNKITKVLYFIINQKGTQQDLNNWIQKNIKDSTEKETAISLLQNNLYGKSLNS